MRFGRSLEASEPSGGVRGDFIDRGPEQRRTVELARRMVDADTALAAHVDELVRSQLLDTPLDAQARAGMRAHPVCLGHYWLTGTPALLSSRAVCVDYSAGKGGPLVA